MVALPASSGLITVFIQLPGSSNSEVIDTTGQYVGQLKKAIIAEFKLDAAPQQLQLFKLGGDGSRTLLDPTHTLTDADIVTQTKLVVELTTPARASPFAGFGSLGGTASEAAASAGPRSEAGVALGLLPATVDFRQRFVDLLGRAKVRPQPAVLARLQRLRDTVFLTCATPDEALQWYRWAQELPASVTREFFRSLTGYTLDGAHPTLESLVLAFDEEGAAYMLKIVKSREDMEVEAAVALHGAPHVVPALYEEATRHTGAVFCGLLMPKYERSLEAADVQLSSSVLFHRTTTMVAALNAIHERGWVHMDVKEANIFVDFVGQWWIGDFGSCVRVGTAIVSTTVSCHPKGVQLLGTPSKWEYDWYMLAVAILHQYDRSFSPSSENSSIAFDTTVRQRCDTVAEPLRGMLFGMLECRTPEFTCILPERPFAASSSAAAGVSTQISAACENRLEKGGASGVQPVLPIGVLPGAIS